MWKFYVWQKEKVGEKDEDEVWYCSCVVLLCCKTGVA